MNIKGKKIAFLGDSITSGVGTSSLKKVYWKVIERKTGAVCSGFGISGTRIAKQIVADPDAVHDRMHFITRIDKIEVKRVSKDRRAKLYYIRDRVGKADKNKKKIEQ